jgi:hypothetical protein
VTKSFGICGDVPHEPDHLHDLAILRSDRKDVFPQAMVPHETSLKLCFVQGRISSEHLSHLSSVRELCDDGRREEIPGEQIQLSF